MLYTQPELIYVSSLYIQLFKQKLSLYGLLTCQPLNLVCV